MSKLRKSTSLKAAAVALGVAGIVGLTISSAASLNLSGGSVGAGTSVVAACQPAGTPITVSFTTAYSASTPGYAVTGVNLGSIAPACAGQSVKVTLTGTGGVSLGELTGTVAGSTLTLAASGSVDATSVVGTSVVVYN